MISTREFDWEGLLGRTFPRFDPAIACEEITGQTILVTGAGGSVGSALVEAVGAHNPRRILLLEASEQALYRIDRDLAAPHAAILGNVLDHRILNDIFESYQPEIVFHAAAFKHVPLMEFNPFAAIQNNAIGTFILAQAALQYQVRKFVMISTDKAVHPGSIMGASKRIAELVLLALSTGTTRMNSVRLGNVLGSQGSVIPLLMGQIATGRPVTVTDPDASRYFVSPEEAVHLLLAALSDRFHRGILVPELGEPIVIAEIARRLVNMLPESQRAASPIVFIGLRPGDKLSEQLLSSTESFADESLGSLRAIHSHGLSFSEIKKAIGKLEESIEERCLTKLLDVVSRLVPDYRLSAVVQNLLKAGALAECRA